jgi:hypothetical protein
MILRCEVVRQVGFVWAYRGRVGDFYSQYETGMRLLRVRALPSLHRHRHEIAQIAPQPDTKIEHNQLDTTRDSRAASGRRDE